MNGKKFVRHGNSTARQEKNVPMRRHFPCEKENISSSCEMDKRKSEMINNSHETAWANCCLSKTTDAFGDGAAAAGMELMLKDCWDISLVLVVGLE